MVSSELCHSAVKEIQLVACLGSYEVPCRLVLAWVKLGTDIECPL